MVEWYTWCECGNVEYQCPCPFPDCGCCEDICDCICDVCCPCCDCDCSVDCCCDLCCSCISAICTPIGDCCENRVCNCELCFALKGRILAAAFFWIPDVLLDILVLVQWFIAGETFWATLLLVFVTISSFITAAKACYIDRKGFLGCLCGLANIEHLWSTCSISFLDDYDSDLEERFYTTRMIQIWFRSYPCGAIQLFALIFGTLKLSNGPHVPQVSIGLELSVATSIMSLSVGTLSVILFNQSHLRNLGWGFRFSYIFAMGFDFLIRVGSLALLASIPSWEPTAIIIGLVILIVVESFFYARLFLTFAPNDDEYTSKAIRNSVMFGWTGLFFGGLYVDGFFQWKQTAKSRVSVYEVFTRYTIALVFMICWSASEYKDNVSGFVLWITVLSTTFFLQMCLLAYRLQCGLPKEAEKVYQATPASPDSAVV